MMNQANQLSFMACVWDVNLYCFAQDCKVSNQSKIFN